MTHKVNEYISEDITQDDTVVFTPAADRTLRLANVTTFSEKTQLL